MLPETRNHLLVIRDAGSLIIDSTADVSFHDYQADWMLRSAVERQFEIVGEAVNRISHAERAIAEKITGYQTIIGFRNRIAHEYDNLANRTVWDIIQRKLPVLLNEVTTILESD